jgi:hypothetical protein
MKNRGYLRAIKRKFTQKNKKNRSEVNMDLIKSLEELVTYKKFKDADIANDIAEKLKLGGVYFEIQNEDKFFDPTFANNPMHNDIRIKLSSQDFSKADKVLENYYQNLLDQVKESHYLFSFTNVELFEIMSKPDEWGDLDYQLAQKILKDRGKETPAATLEALKENRLNILSKPEQSQIGLVFGGYAINFIGCISLYLNLRFRFIWIPIAAIIGAIISQTKKTLPTGEVVFSFNEKDRKHGKVILILSIFFVLVILILLFLNRIQIITQKLY